MTVELDLTPVAEWAAGLPAWAWVLIAVQKWYLLAGLVIRRHVRKDPDSWNYDITVGPTPWFFWLVSPVLSVYFVFLALFVVVQAFGWVSSAGVVPPPWRKAD